MLVVSYIEEFDTRLGKKIQCLASCIKFKVLNTILRFFSKFANETNGDVLHFSSSLNLSRSQGAI